MQWFQYHLYTKCSHLYNNLESFHLFILFFFFLHCSQLLRTNQRDSSSRPASSWLGKNKKEPVHPVCLLHTQSCFRLGSLGHSGARRQARRQKHVPTCCCWWLGAAGGRGAFMAQVGLGKKKERKKKNRTALGESWGCQVCLFFFLNKKIK